MAETEKKVVATEAAEKKPAAKKTAAKKTTTAKKPAAKKAEGEKAPAKKGCLQEGCRCCYCYRQAGSQPVRPQREADRYRSEPGSEEDRRRDRSA